MFKEHLAFGGFPEQNPVCGGGAGLLVRSNAPKNHDVHYVHDSTALYMELCGVCMYIYIYIYVYIYST